ncbi:MAG: flavodoxin family protein [Coriobacteriales bacterium]|jgi:NAD(P)H-dependent FMN reductase
MKKLVAVNASPRTNWNTAQLIRAAAQGAEEAGAEVEVIDLYKIENYQGCRSCFACKGEKFYGQCIFKDGLKPVLDSIREADALVLGTPNYFGRPTAGFRALYERLIFQYLTYRTAQPSCNERPIPVLFIMTSNLDAEGYDNYGYTPMIEEYESTLEQFIGPVTTYICGNTLQVNDYSRYDWDYFDIPGKIKRHEEVFPSELEEVKAIGAKLIG